MENRAKRLYRGLAGLIFVLAVGITIAALGLILTSNAASQERAQAPTATLTAIVTFTPTQTNTPEPTATLYMTPTWTPFPTADADLIATSAAQPVLPVGSAVAVSRHESPYTINPSAQRTQIVFYTVQRGDTIKAITERFGIGLDTLVWTNRRFYVNALSVGFVMRILPFNGAIHRVQEPMSIAALASQYLVDPYAIIDSDLNQLKDALPEEFLPVGLEVVIPGGVGSREALYYEPPGSAAITGSFGSTSIYQGIAVFGEGQPGSCGRQPVYGGSMPSSKPVYGYVLTVDFSTDHPGVDLAATLGEPVLAVGDGTVIFSGLSTWGYGYTVVIAHGSIMSLYAHLNGTVVRCGQQVTAGQYVGNVGSTGNSSGPHLHFEIRNSAGTRENPHTYLGL